MVAMPTDEVRLSRATGNAYARPRYVQGLHRQKSHQLSRRRPQSTSGLLFLSDDQQVTGAVVCEAIRVKFEWR